MIVMRLALVLGLAMMLGGCSGTMGSLKELRALAPQADDFENSLAAEYLGYSESEEEQGHSLSAEHFASKGLGVSRHEQVLPDMPDDSQQDLLSSRNQLLAILTEDVKHVAPQKAARAQLLYDCWLVQHKDRGNNGLMPCRDEFLSTMNELQAVADEFIFGEELSHSLQFAEGSNVISTKARAEIHAIAEYIKPITNYVLLLTDYAMHNPQAEALAARRLAAVRAAFVKVGIDDARIKHSNRDDAKEVLLSGDNLEHNTIDVTVRTSSPGGQ